MQTSQILLLFVLLMPLALAGLSFGPTGGQKHHKPSQSMRIKGGIGDGYIYPAKSRHQRKGGSGGLNAQTYKLIIQNANSQGGPQQHQAPQHQPTQVKTFKVIQERASAPAAAAHGHNAVKTIKLIHVNGGNGGCPSGGQGW